MPARARAVLLSRVKANSSENTWWRHDSFTFWLAMLAPCVDLCVGGVLLLGWLGEKFGWF
jgi:hypothetical protein